MATRMLYLVRHGQYRNLPLLKSENGSGGDEATRRRDGGLTAVGREQALLTARRLHSLTLTAIYHSTLPRAEQTAAIIAAEFPGVPVHRSRSLWECIPGRPAQLADFFRDHPEEDLITGQQQAARVYQRFFRLARGDDKLEVLVCHGNLLRYLVSRALGVPGDTWGRMDVNNCGISTIMIRPEGTWLLGHNDIGHLPPRLQTFN